MAPHFEIGRVSPIDAVVTIRSLPRRFGETFARAASPEQPTPEMLGHAVWTATALAVVQEALRRVMVEQDPVLDLPPVDPPAPVRAEDPLGAVLATLAAAAGSLADAMAGIGGRDWTRTGQTPNGPVTALDIVQVAVRIGIEHLRSAEAAIAGAREGAGDAGGSGG
jgi:hypothetical protein